MPTYSEVTNIQLLLKSIKTYTKTINGANFLVVVDDNSPDGISDLARQTAKILNSPNFNVKIIKRKIKDGYGKACIEGMKYLISNDFDFIMSMDSDLSHNPRYLKKFVNKAASNSDFIVGSRYIDGGATPDWSIIRKLLSRYGNYYARIFLGCRISDYTGGFNMYSKNLLEKIDLDSINASGYGFLIELKYKALMQAKNIFQIPIIFHYRQNGKSKIPKITIIKNFSLVPRLKFTVKK